MKKIIFFMLLFVAPFIVNAKICEIENIEHNEIVKYYKTVSMINNDNIQIIGILPQSYSIEISKEEYEKYNPELEYDLNSVKVGYTETNYKKMTTTITKINDTMFRLKVILDWKTMPSTRSYDIIGIGFPATVTATDLTYFSQNYCLSNGNCSQRTSHSLYIGAYGVGASFSLPAESITSLSQSFSVDIKKTNSSNTLTSLNVSGDYSHAQKIISQKNAKKYKVDLTGISLDSSISSYYDSINSAVATWTGTW